jgi:hypothetical protein
MFGALKVRLQMIRGSKSDHGLRYLSLLLLILLGGCSSPIDVNSDQIQDLLNGLSPLVEVLRFIAIGAGLVLLVAGWKIYRLVVALPGFLIGAALGVWIGHQVSGDLTFALIGFAVGGLIGVWLARVVHDIALFVVGAVGGVYVMQNVWGYLSELTPSTWVLVLGAILGGGLLLALSRHWMVFLSSVIGAMMFVWGVQVDIAWILVAFVFGLVMQYGISRALGEKAFARFKRSKS